MPHFSILLQSPTYIHLLNFTNTDSQAVQITMEYTAYFKFSMLVLIGLVVYSEGKTNMFEILISRNKCLEESSKEECNIGFFKSICSNRKAFSFGNEGNAPELCNCVERFSR